MHTTRGAVVVSEGDDVERRRAFLVNQLAAARVAAAMTAAGLVLACRGGSEAELERAAEAAQASAAELRMALQAHRLSSG